jgi:acyl-coenzyme A synthetase/AMP-(fatty) acid ligase
MRTIAGPKTTAVAKITMPNFMQPAEVVWLDAFPKSANGKLDRNVLAECLNR